MTYCTAIHFCDERYREGLGGAQCLDDELFSVVADLQRLKRRNGHLAYRAYISLGFAPDNDPRVHVIRVTPLLLTNGHAQARARS